MSIVVISQPMRLKQAAAYLWSRPEEEPKVVVTQDTSRLDISSFPPDTEFHAWGPMGGGSLAPRTVADRLTEGAKSYLRGGSPLAAGLGRWLKSAEWRLRYLDRVQTLVQGRGAARLTESRNELVELLRELLSSYRGEIVVFDLFDLPAVLRSQESADVQIAVF